MARTALTNYSIVRKNCDMPAVAMTDHGNMFGAMKFYHAARERGINPILGCEAYISPTTRFDRTKQRIGAVAHHLDAPRYEL